MATQIMQLQAIGPSMKPLVSPPSPTLTNPDMVLPNEPIRFPAFTSPSRRAWRDRPPSPSYLRDKTNEVERERSGNTGSAMFTPKKEKRGLMSRKMLLLRSRTASNGTGVNGFQSAPRNVSSEARLQDFRDFDSAYGSSPTLMDVGNLASEQPKPRPLSVGGSSGESDDMTGLPQFLAKYDNRETIGTDDGLDSDSQATQTNGYSESIQNGLDAHRRQQEEEEHNSAILSKRAEQILANAKKRLNLMEGNLRGARDLVHPLTAANLKRATSVGSSFASGGAVQSGRRLYLQDDYHYQPATPPQHRKLHAQASSPTIGQDFQGHWRGFSETEVPNRPSTALERTNTPVGLVGGLPVTKVPNRPSTAFERTNTPMRLQGGIPVHQDEVQWSNPLRVSRSYDSLGINAIRRPSVRQVYSRGSPDSNLEPLVEQDVYDYAVSPPSSQFSDQQDGLGIRRPSSRGDDLREQMSSLKGRISSLRERAREDSLRRQSMQNLRQPSPFNNATANPPEFFYTSSPGYGTPVLDTNAGVGETSQSNSPATPDFPQRMWEPKQAFTGSPNAFAEQAQRTHKRAQGSDGSSQSSPLKVRQADDSGQPSQPASLHKRTASGTAIVQSSKHRYSHHQQSHSRSESGNLPQGQQSGDEIDLALTEAQNELWDGHSEAGASKYEDADSEQPPVAVAHEDREDAFDYETFFLHSAMSGSYTDAMRRASASSEDTVSSVETARGPTTVGVEDEGHQDEFDVQNENYPPPTPETPEQLREIERNLHKRTFSDESVSTIATFATATEGPESPIAKSKPTSALEWPLQPAENSSRPSTVIPVKRPSPIANSDSSSERADSGIGISNRPNSSQSSKRTPLRSLKSKTSFPGFSTAAMSTRSPPMSPQVLTNPATVAVNALLDPNGRQLGLKDKALVFGLIESLKNTCLKLQEKPEGDYDSRILRRQLDDARRVLDGASVPRPVAT